MAWAIELLDSRVKAELDALPKDMRASFERIVRLIQSQGLERVREPYVKHLDDALWELRLKGRDGIARAIYMTATGRRIVVLRVFTKRTRKTPRRELELAARRAKEIS